MKLEYDPTADGIYIYFNRKRRSFRTKEVPCKHHVVLVDYDKEDNPIGVEILGTREAIDLAGLPRAEEIAALLQGHGFKVLVSH